MQRHARTHARTQTKQLHRAHSGQCHNGSTHRDVDLLRANLVKCASFAANISRARARVYIIGRPASGKSGESKFTARACMAYDCCGKRSSRSRSRSITVDLKKGECERASIDDRRRPRRAFQTNAINDHDDDDADEDAAFATRRRPSCSNLVTRLAGKLSAQTQCHRLFAAKFVSRCISCALHTHTHNVTTQSRVLSQAFIARTVNRRPRVSPDVRARIYK